MNKQTAKTLLEKYNSGEISDEELSLLESWYLDWPADQAVNLSEQEIKDELELMRLVIPQLVKEKPVIRLWPKLAAAAAILLVLGVGAYFLSNRLTTQPRSYYVHDIKPGANRATLTLANGTKISLDDAKIGKMAIEGNAVIKKAADGMIIYDLSKLDLPESKTISYNTIETPRGGEYKIILSDGTAVWLNADSHLKFPTAFTGGERKVELRGEGYFEVAKNAKMPFKVLSSSQKVEVLGTHFNVSVYADDLFAKTTLLEGSVKMNDQTILKPGEQSLIGHHQIKVEKVDAENEVAWKNGKFKFENENIKDIMRKIARWYDVEITYQGDVTRQDFSGSVSRFDKVSKILDLLESTHTVHFEVEGRRIIVMP